MSVTIEPTVTPAPKPEWEEHKTNLVRTVDGTISTIEADPDLLAMTKLILLATITIPSSTECERKAKVEGAKERVLFAAEQWVRALDAACGDKLIQEVEALWKIEQEAP